MYYTVAKLLIFADYYNWNLSLCWKCPTAPIRDVCSGVAQVQHGWVFIWFSAIQPQQHFSRWTYSNSPPTLNIFLSGSKKQGNNKIQSLLQCLRKAESSKWVQCKNINKWRELLLIYVKPVWVFYEPQVGSCCYLPWTAILHPWKKALSKYTTCSMTALPWMWSTWVFDMTFTLFHIWNFSRFEYNPIWLHFWILTLCPC
jgi:hypothetical protein